MFTSRPSGQIGWSGWQTKQLIASDERVFPRCLARSICIFNSFSSIASRDSAPRFRSPSESRRAKSELIKRHLIRSKLIAPFSSNRQTKRAHNEDDGIAEMWKSWFQYRNSSQALRPRRWVNRSFHGLIRTDKSVLIIAVSSKGRFQSWGINFASLLLTMNG